MILTHFFPVELAQLSCCFDIALKQYVHSKDEKLCIKNALIKVKYDKQ